MADIVDRDTRSRMMAGIRGKNTRPELLIRSGLHGLGFRFRLHRRDLPGNPDIVLPRYRACVFVNGCFWHGHDCHLFKWPRTRPQFWRQKIGRNQAKDRESRHQLRDQGWRTLCIWECALKGKTRLPSDCLLKEIEGWMLSGPAELDITGNCDPECLSDAGE